MEESMIMIENKMKIYKMYIRTILTYAVETKAKISKTKNDGNDSDQNQLERQNEK